MRRPTCHRPRLVNLARNPITWIDALRNAWSDLLDPSLPFAIFVVRPRPPQFRTFRSACHIILEQAPNAQSAAVVLTTLIEGTARDGMIQGAFSIGTRINMAEVIRAMDAAHYCAGHQCILFSSGRAVPLNDWIEVVTGSSLYLRVMAQHQDDEELDQIRLHFDDLALMQTTGFHFNPDAAVFQPGQGTIHTQPEHLQDLFSCWDRCACAWETESRAAHILTWFVSPGIGRMRCMHSRKVTLFQDFTQWEDIMKARWREIIDPASPVTFVVAQPAPPHMEPSISAHVLLMQHELPDLSSPLVTTYDPAINHGMPFRVVLTLNERATKPEVINAMGYTRDCQCPGTNCNVWHERVFVQPGSLMAVRDGDCIVMQVSRTMLPADWQPPVVPETPGTEGLNFLQTRASRITHVASNEHTLEPPDEVKLEMKPAIAAFEWIDQHLFLPSLVIPEGVKLQPASREWVEAIPWMIGQPCDAIWIYLDGSYKPEDKVAGIGVAAFIRSGSTWYTAGMLSSRIQASESYTPEVAAALVASKFAFDLIKQVLFAQTSPCAIWIGFDSLTVGQQMIGAWNSYKAPRATSVIRSLHRLIETRFGIVP